MDHKELRVVIDGPKEGSLNMGIDFALLKNVGAREASPTLRLYSWKSPTITIGYFQNPRVEIYTEKAKQESVSIIRRITGGGTVLHDAELTYSLILPNSHPVASQTVFDSFLTLASPIIEGLKKCGIEAEFQPLNDIISSGKKISGNAQTRRMGGILQHGTLLLDLNKPLMTSLLTGAGSNKMHTFNSESGTQYIKESVPVNRVSCIKEIVGERYSVELVEQIKKGIIESAGKILELTPKINTITQKEEEDAHEAIEQLFLPL